MRTLGLFLALILVTLAAMAALTYPVWLWLYPHFGFPFHRVADRIGMLVLGAGTLVLARRLGLWDRASWGFGAPRAVFLRELLIGFALGAPLMAGVVGVMAALHLREWKAGLALDAASLTAIAGMGLLRGCAVALIEETFLRGVLFSGIARESGVRVAVLATAILYAITHFVGRYHIAADRVGPFSGLELLAGTLSGLAHPLGIADAFLCLAAVGAVLGLVRALTGHIGACLGLHASWVWVITFVRETSGPDPHAPLGFLLSRFDGVVGWLVLGWTVLIGVALGAFYRRRRAAGFAIRGG